MRYPTTEEPDVSVYRPSGKPNEQDLERLQPYVRYLADRLGLKDWTIKVTEREAENEADAEVKATYGLKHASLRLGRFFMDRSDTEQRAILIHELCHCLSDPLWQLVHSDSLEAVVGQAAHGVIVGNFDERNEIMVDTFALILSPFFLTPKQFRKQQKKTK